MRKFSFLVFVGLVVNVFANEISLWDWGLNINGTVFTSPSNLPDNAAFSDDLFENGIGTLTLSFESAISAEFSVASFFDYEIDEQNNTFFNEYGVIEGISNDTRLSYEIDEPGYGNGEYTGDIYENFITFQSHDFDGKVFYGGFTDTYLSDFEDPVSDDVSMAMGWKFLLKYNEKASVEYTVSTLKPTTGLFLSQIDRYNEGTALYMQSKLKITSVPEPSLMNLLGMSLFFFGIFIKCKRTRAKKVKL